MQENEFEKQVQQKMDDLKLHPSAAVWQKIESQIRKEKRRRWILIFLPLLLIGFLYGGYMLFNNNDPDLPSQQQVTKNTNEKNNATKHPTPIYNSIKNNHVPEGTEPADTKSEDVKQGSSQKTKIPGTLKVTSNYDVATTLSRDITPDKTTRKESIVANEKVNIDIQNPVQETIVDKEIIPGSTITEVKELPKQDEVHPVKDTVETKNENTKTENLIKIEAPITIKNKYPWKWGLTFSAGVSSMANNFLEYRQQRSDQPVFSSAPITANPRPGPSLIRPSVAFIAGVVTEKNVSKKILLTSGINYKLFSTTNRAGNDSAGFYGTSNANTFHNYYQYIELPVGFKFQLADFKKSLLYWNAGLSVSQLIGAKALQYNSSRGLYYHDNSLFNKTQFGFNTGIDISMPSKNNRSFLIGPYLNYGISKIASQGYNNHHFTFIGLRAQYLFGKK